MLWDCLFVSTLLLMTSICHGAPKRDSCIDVDGAKILDGASYMPTTDPCTHCTCRNSVPVLCLSALCARPSCSKFEQVPRKCCEYKCIDDAGNGREEHKKGTAGECVDRQGQTVHDGAQYEPEESDPCMMCTCLEGTAQHCLTVACVPPTDCSWEPVDGECCSFRCLDKCEDDQGRQVMHGQIYTPNAADPCTQCLCTDGSPGMCATTMCDVPKCSRYEVIEGVCCGFKCLEEDSMRGCISDDGTVTPHGEPYLPLVDDACTFCLCDNGTASLCAAVGCVLPTCDTYEKLEGACCEFKCLTPAAGEGSCFDNEDRAVEHGAVYHPDSSDPCMECTCKNGVPHMCLTVACIPPDCQYEMLEGCCKFRCLD